MHVYRGLHPHTRRHMLVTQATIAVCLSICPLALTVAVTPQTSARGRVGVVRVDDGCDTRRTCGAERTGALAAALEEWALTLCGGRRSRSPNLDPGSRGRVVSSNACSCRMKHDGESLGGLRERPGPTAATVAGISTLTSRMTKSA